MEVAQVENKLLQGWMTELRGQQTAITVSSARTYPYLCTIVQLQLQFGFIAYEPVPHPKVLVEFSFIKLLKEKARHQFFNFEYLRISNNSYKINNFNFSCSKAHLHLLYTRMLHTTIIVWFHSLQCKCCVFASKIEVCIEEFFLTITGFCIQFFSVCSLAGQLQILRHLLMNTLQLLSTVCMSRPFITAVLPLQVQRTPPPVKPKPRTVKRVEVQEACHININILVLLNRT